LLDWIEERIQAGGPFAAHAILGQMAKNGGQLAAAVELVKRASKGSGSSMPQPAAVRITFVPKKAPAGRRVSFRTGKGYAVRFDAPRLESFVHLDIKPSNVLIGAGLQVTEDIPASAIVEAGLPAMLVRDFALASGMTMADIGSVVGTSERTMSRKVGSGESLEPAESDRAYRLFDAVARAVHAFGDVEKARHWLRREVPSLGGRTPVDLLRTEIGTRDVLSALDRIEYGGIA
jgi:putative toxin-antitoxin system antitoxin component (TIGR02293 family)